MTADDLRLSDAELTQLREALTTMGRPAAIEDTIIEQEQRVAEYSARYSVPYTTLLRLTRALVLFELLTLVNQSSDARTKAYDEAMAELRDIRDGKLFLPVADTDPDRPAGSAAWGGNDHVA